MVPNLGLYYLAAQSSHFYHIDKSIQQRYLSLVCGPSESHLLHPFCHVLRGLRGSPSFLRHSVFFCLLSFHHRWVWLSVMSKTNSPMFYSNTHLWYNKMLPELLQLPDPSMWSSGGIFMLSHVLSCGKLKTFEQLKFEFSLPNHMLF